MEIIKINFPLGLKGTSLQNSLRKASQFWNSSSQIFYFTINPKLLLLLIIFLSSVLVYHMFEPRQIMYIKNIVIKSGNEILDQPFLNELKGNPPSIISEKPPKQNSIFGLFPFNSESNEDSSVDPNSDPLGSIISSYEKNENYISSNNKSFNEKFIVEKQLLITKYLIQERVARLDQLSNKSILKLSDQIAKRYIDLVLIKMRPKSHVYNFFTDTTDLKKIQTAFVEQIKYHVPASITLAQSALETAYGKRVINNNYFGIKDKLKNSKVNTTTEYYTKKEVKANRHKILSKAKLKVDGKTLYKCKIKDHFMEYQSPWQSFRGHSIYLNKNKRYASLFTNGKDYKAWADKIGSVKNGGVGYATSPLYGALLKKIIKQYRLDLLDH